ncbi:MAG: histone H1 [Chloroflexota bacterium]
MNRYEELLNLVKSFEMNFRKFYLKGNKAAGIRLRKNMQDLRKFSKSIRDEVQKINQENDAAMAQLKNDLANEGGEKE